MEEKARTFHAVEDLPCDLDCRDDCGKTLVKEYDILNPNYAVGKCHSNYDTMLTAALRAASDAPWTAIPQSAYSDVRYIGTREERDKTVPS